MKKFFGLGKGISSLIPDSLGEDVNAKREHVFYVEVSKIQSNPDQPRKEFDKDALEDLAKSIRKYGVLQPLLVSKREEDLPRGRAVSYTLIAGERRWRAAQIAGLPQVPVIIRDDLAPTATDSTNQSTRLEVALIENLQREDLNALETAEAYFRLANEFGLKQQEIADKVGKSREAVANILRLLNLPQYIKDDLRAGRMTSTMARGLLAFQADPDAQKRAYEAGMKGGFSTKDLEQAASAVKNAAGKRRWRHNEKYDELMKNLTDHLGTPVIIHAAHVKGNGQVVIRFNTQEDLNTITKKILD